MPLPSKLRRRVGDAVDAERRVLPPLAAASRQSSLWSVEEPELVRNASHLRAIARQQQSLRTKPKPQSFTAATVSAGRVSPRAPVAVLVPLKNSKPHEITTRNTTNNNNDGEGDSVLHEIWRVAEKAAKQQSSKTVVFDNSICSVRASVGPRDPVGNQEAETNDGNGTTKARYRRLVGMFARKTLMGIVLQAAQNVVRMRLENGCAVGIQRVVRRFLGRCRRARLRFVMVDAVEKIERQWKRTKARRAAVIQRNERRRKEVEKKKAEEERLAASREIQARYREFVEAKKKQKVEAARRRRDDVEEQQRLADEEMKRTAACVIQRKLRNVRRRIRELRGRTTTRGFDAQRKVVEETAQSVNGNAETEASIWIAHAAVAERDDGGAAGSEAAVDPLIPRGSQEHSAVDNAVDHERIPTAASEPTHQERVRPDVMDFTVPRSHATATTSVVHTHTTNWSEHEVNLSSPREPQPFTAPNTDSLICPPTSAPQVFRTHFVCSIPDPHEAILPVVESDHVARLASSCASSVSAPALRRARTVISHFVVNRCLSHLRHQLHTKHKAALRLQQLVRRRLARRRVMFQRQLHLISLRSELQTQWLRSESLLMARIMGDDATTSPIDDHETTGDDELLDDEDDDFLSDDDSKSSHVDSAGGLSWTELLPTRNGVIPSGLRLDFSASHGPSSAAAPCIGLWKWSWASQRWRPNAELFSVANTSPEA